jgi:hypothetical protein
MLRDRKLEIAWEAWLTERGVMQALEPASETAQRVRGYFGRQLRAGVKALESDTLAEALIELETLVIEEARIGRWQLPRRQDMLLRITEPLAPSGVQAVRPEAA